MTGAGDATPEQRLEKLRGLLTGTRGGSRIGQALAGARKRNVVIGAALHGAARLRAGHAPTDLEQALLGVMRASLTDAEIKEWGRVYREAVDAQGGKVDVLPDTITGRPVASGYSLANLKADFAHVAQEHLEQQNLSVMDPEALAAGATVDSQTFLNATRRVGFGATAPRSQPAQGGGESPALTYPVKLQLESFRVVREVGDGISGKDEIYWYITSSSDKQKGPVYKSAEFSTKEGNTYEFPANTVIFDGQASNGVAVFLMCWEADNSSSEWYDKLQTAMQALNTQLLNTWQWQVGGAIGDPTMVGGILLELIGLFATLISLWRNEDDLSCERGIALDQQTLAVLTHRGSADWHFDGDGYHVLKVRSTGPKVPFPTGTLEYAVRTGNTWGAPIPLPWESITPPALASYNNKLYALFVRSDQAVMWTRLDGQTWRKPEQVGGDRSVFAPAVTAAHGKLFYAVTGSGDKLYWRTYTENGGWSTITQFPSYNSGYSPAMAAYSNRVWLTHAAPGAGELWLNTHDGTNWSTHYGDNLGWRVGNSIALASHGGLLWRIARGLDDHVYVSASDGGSHFTDHGIKKNWTTTHAPALASYNDALWILLRAGDGTLRAAARTSVNHAWSETHQVGGQVPITTIDGPTTTVHHNKLYVMYRR
ncbi:hypothetical protein ACTU45_13345 [Streptomyces sp. 24-1644]|uniref:hypothetical protein n=1 Tax=Streptomyces sp. 24-1644 TaxID=3457315 RepID=UPI003FA6B7AD